MFSGIIWFNFDDFSGKNLPYQRFLYLIAFFICHNPKVMVSIFVTLNCEWVKISKIVQGGSDHWAGPDDSASPFLPINRLWAQSTKWNLAPLLDKDTNYSEAGCWSFTSSGTSEETGAMTCQNW